MPAISVKLDEKVVASVSSEFLDLMDVRVMGDVLGPEPASLSVSGGSYPEGEVSQYLTWVDQHSLALGQKVTVTFYETGDTSHPGRTIEELYPAESKEPLPQFAPVEAVVREISLRPKHFESLSFRLMTPDGAVVDGRTTPEEHGFGFSVDWNSYRPMQVRVSLHTYTLDCLIRRENGTYHFDQKVGYGESVSFEIRA